MFLTPQMIAIIAVIAVGYFIFTAAQQAAARKAAEKAEQLTVARVQLGFNALATVGLRDHIERMVREGNLGTDVGLWRLAQRVLERVQTELDNVEYAGWQEHPSLEPMKGEAQFMTLTREARGHFDREIVRRDAKGLETAKRNSDKATDLLDEDGEFGIAELFIVTLIMASRGAPIGMPAAVGGHEDVASSVQALLAVGRDRQIGFEVIWTPAAESDILTKDELLGEYPYLAPL
ncbi:MAG: putative membrane protein [Myxococcota bacterium]|jgi:uncharacterized membrane protein